MKTDYIINFCCGEMRLGSRLQRSCKYDRPGADYSSLGVKPTDDNKASVYQNSDHAGTPEAFRSYVVGGARGGGGSNYTGSYSGTLSDVCQ